jgi:hypothetical protein
VTARGEAGKPGRATVDEIKAALDAITPGEWKWHGIAAPDWMPDTVIAADNLRVTRPTPDGIADQEIAFVVEAMKSGFVMVRNADAELIANAPDWLRELLAERERLEREAAAGRVLAEEILATNRELTASEGLGNVVPAHRAIARMAFALVAYDKAVSE